MESKYLKIEPIGDVSQSEFEPYGQIVGLYNEPPMEDFEHLKYYKDNIMLGTSKEGSEEVTLGLLHCKKRKNGEPITKLERHPLFTETFIPLHGGEVVFVMAPSDNSKEMPDIDKIRIFLLDGKLGVSLNKGTWHWPPMPIREHANISLLSKGKLFSGTDIVDIGIKVYPVF